MSTHDNRSNEGGFPRDSFASEATRAISTSRTADAEYESKHGGGSISDDDGFDAADARDTTAPAHPADDFATEPERGPARWTGGADLGLLILRLVVGGTFVAHGAQKLFGVLGGPGRDGFAKFLYSNGFHHIQALTWVTGGTELVGGGLLVLGLFTPLAAAGLLAVIGNAIALKVHPSVIDAGWLTPGGKGFEYEAVLAAGAAALLFAGSGRIALDFRRVWFRRPLLFAFICLLVAGAAAAAIWFGSR